MDQLYTEVVVTVLGLVLAAVSAYGTKWISAHVRATDVALAVSVAQSAVKAVEQMAVAHNWQPAEKLDTAIARAHKLATVAGIKLTDDQWRTLVEQAVHELKTDLATILAPPSPTVEVKAP